MDGGLPSRVPLDAKLLETRDFSTFTLRRVQYHSQEDRTNTLLISLPKGVAKAPVLLALHGHENAWGQAAENAYRMGDADDFCAYFAERGWIVVQPATMNHTLHHKDWTLQGEWTWDAMVALDYVATHSEADMDRVAVCGLSTGGHLAMNVLALDDRVKAGVVGCQLSTWNHYRLRMRIPPHCDCGVSKQLGDRLEQCDWAALAAPKPVQFQHGHKDPCYCPGADPKLLNPDWNVAVMPVAEYDTMFAEVQRAYRLASRPENVCTRFHDGGHKVDSEMALRWLQERLVRTVTP
jgi:dienelactone hydrolase